MWLPSRASIAARIFSSALMGQKASRGGELTPAVAGVQAALKQNRQGSDAYKSLDIRNVWGGDGCAGRGDRAGRRRERGRVPGGGEGPGLLLVHGTGATGEINWRPLIDAVRDRYTVVAPDLSGSGATTDAGGPLTVEMLAEQAEAAAAHAGLTTYAVVGHSLGAAVAAAVAGRRPEAVTSLVLHAGLVKTDPQMAFMADLWGGG
ncbi:hypothetical protein GCM10020000_42080 [Streptomyces olivoverticillatus]